ncbi:MAG TPA: GxxExxY protein [Tepidisphaeraceae bacterium]|nr:GxxExxY protein [Tepidisphaeraceae bacterium]
MAQELLLKDEVYALVGAAMAVHNDLKSGYLEAVCQEAMEVELAERGVPFVSQAVVPVWYRGRQLKKGYVADLICYGKIVVELKVTPEITPREEAQLLNYLHATRHRVGVLICFGDPGRLEWQRYVL